jgi:translocation and assembly module TamB
MAPVDQPDNGVATGEGILDFDIERGRLLRGDIVLPFPGRGQITGDFAVTDVSLGVESGVAGNLKVDLSSIRTLSRLAPFVDNASGALRATLNLAGTVTEPQWSGDLSLKDGAFSYGPIGLELTEVDLDGAMDPDFRFDISGTFRAGQGKAEIEIVSRADYSNTDEPGLMFRIRGEQLTLVNVPDVFVEADADIDMALDRETITINGEVTVPNARIRPTDIAGGKVGESEDVVIVAGELPDLSEETQKGSAFEFRGELNVALGDSVVIELDRAKANVTGAVNFTWQGDAMPIANGRYLVNGNIAAFGQVLDIADGSVQFSEVPADQPYIRVRAEREIYGNTQIRRAGVLVDGPVRRPTVEAYTQPLTTEERALALLVTGSDFDFEQGVGAVDFGTYIAPRLFVSYGVGVFERENIISVRFDLARRFGIKASSGSKESGVDLNYRFEN